MHRDLCGFVQTEEHTNTLLGSAHVMRTGQSWARGTAVRGASSSGRETEPSCLTMLPSGRKRSVRYPTDQLTRNTKPDFVGCEGLKKVHRSGPTDGHRGHGSLEAFEKWAKDGVCLACVPDVYVH